MADTLNGHPPRITRDPLAAAGWALFAIALVFYIARLIVRWRASHRFYLDDAWSTLALLVLLISCVLLTVAISPMYDVLRVSAGLQEPDVTFPSDASLYLKLQFALTILFWSCLWCVKGSFLAFFRHFTTGKKWALRGWWAVVAFTLVSYVGCIITLPVACASFRPGACETHLDSHRSGVSLRFSTVVDVITDVMIIALPVYLAYFARPPLHQRIAFGILTFLGILVMIFAIMRIAVANPTGDHVDPSWLNLWSQIEASIAVALSCLLPYKALFKETGRTAHGPSNPHDVVDEDEAWTKGHRRGTSGTTVSVEGNPPLPSMRESIPPGVPEWESRPMRFMGQQKVDPNEVANGLDRVRRSSIIGVKGTF